MPYGMTDAQYAAEIARKSAAGIPMTQPIDTAALARAIAANPAISGAAPTTTPVTTPAVTPVPTTPAPIVTPTPSPVTTGGAVSAPAVATFSSPYASIINQIVYLKGQWEKGKNEGNAGLMKWASNEVAKYYTQLPGDIATTLRGMNYSQASAWYQERKTTPVKEEDKERPPMPDPIEGYDVVWNETTEMWEYEKKEKDPADLEETAKFMDWQQWIFQNQTEIQDVWLRHYGIYLTQDQLLTLASGGAGSDIIFQQLWTARRREAYRPVFVEFNRREPTPSEYAGFDKFPSANDYMKEMTIQRDTPILAKEIEDLLAPLGVTIPTNYYSGQARRLLNVSEMWEGREPFKQMLTRIKTNRESVWKSKLATAQVAMSKEGLLTFPTMKGLK